MPIKIEVQAKGLDKLASMLSVEKMHKAMDIFLDESAEVVRAEVRAFAPMRTGRLIESIQKIKLGEMHYAVGSPLDYALYQEVGTRPHMIYPRSAKALRFEIGGIEVFARYVRHPGFPGRRYFAKALAYYSIIWRDLAKRVISMVMRE
jgi:hypothetical protein